MAFTYPSQYDSSQLLLTLIGTFWANEHEDPVVRSYAKARGKAELQSAVNFKELEASAGRHTVPLFHRVRLAPHRILQSERQLATLGDETNLSLWAAPDGLVYVPAIANRPTDQTVLLIHNIDFKMVVDDGIYFVDDPFLNPLFEQTPILDETGEEVDSEITVWLIQADFDQTIAFEQFGYAVNFSLPSAEYRAQERDALNEYLDAVVGGSTRGQIERSLSIFTGLPLANVDGEVVEVISYDAVSRLVITDRSVYRVPFPLDTVPVNILVSVGDELRAGQAICDALRLYDLNRGIDTASVTFNELPALTLSPKFTDPTISGDLTFENVDLPVVVTTDLGFTRIDLALTGAAGDVDQFWDLVHARGIASGTTLAMYLNTGNPDVQPIAANLPATLNPFRILTDWVFRYNAVLVLLKSPVIPDSAPGLLDNLDALRMLRRIIPPNQMVLVLDVTEYDSLGVPITYTTTNLSDP